MTKNTYLYLVVLAVMLLGASAPTLAETPRTLSLECTEKHGGNGISALGLYVDTGKPFSTNGTTGTTCWNRIVNNEPSLFSFAGHQGFWYLFNGTDCPTDTPTMVMKSWQMTSSDPIQDVSCIQHPPISVSCKTTQKDVQGKYVDSGKPFATDGVTGTTCWNRTDGARSLAGHGDFWFFFLGEDCPPDSTLVIASYEKKISDPVADIPCAHSPWLYIDCRGKGSGTYLDSGKPFVADNQTGSTCWNSIGEEKAMSFAGLGDSWFVFLGADCPADPSLIINTWPKKSYNPDPVADRPSCVRR